MKRQPRRLERVSVTVPDEALEVYEAALGSCCDTVDFFRDHASGDWTLDGVRDAEACDTALTTALALAAAVTGVTAPPLRAAIPADGWLERTRLSFPEQLVGRRFAIRGTHLTGMAPSGRITLVLDAGVAFGSGEHSSTRGCLIAFEGLMPRSRRIPGGRRPRVLDLGTGSGILAMAAVKALHRNVLATDIEPWAIRVTRGNARRNQVATLVRPVLADGWRSAEVRKYAPFSLVFANILARPLRQMARDLARHLAPGGRAVLSGLLHSQARDVLAAHRRNGLVLQRAIHLHPWTTLVIRRK